MATKKKSTYCIIRTDRAGCFAGELTNREGDTVTLANARRLWYWSGAASLSQLAVSGTSKPRECKFPEPVPSITVFGVLEIITTTDVARQSIEAVPTWRA